MNNFDTCSTMEDISFEVFHDTALARQEFEENFILNGCQTNTWFYTDNGQEEKPNYVSNCYDFSECKEKDFRAYCLDKSVESLRDTIQEMRSYHGTWKSYAIYLMDEDGFRPAIKDGFPDINNAKVLYETCSVTGFSQGDYATVLYKIEDYSKDGKLRDYFCNLFYSSPIYARIEIDGEEYNPFEDTGSPYEWDKDKVLEWVKENVPNLSHQARKWIEKNLPEHPEYI